MYKVNYTDSERDELLGMTREGALAVFLYSPYVLAGGERHLYDEGDKGVRAIARGGVISVPVSFFERFLGKAPDCFSAKGGYLPVIEAARSLGYSAEAFYDERLVLIGTPEQIERVRANPMLAEAGAYAVIGEYDASAFTSEDYKAVREKWKRLLVGSPELNDESNPVIKEKIEIISAAGERFWSTMNKGDGRTLLWGEGLPEKSDVLGEHYRKLADLAKAWGTYGSTLYHNEELRQDIIDGVRWMYEHLYGEAEIEERGWRDPRQFNWWDWYIPSPTFMTDVFFIMEDSFPIEDRKRYLRCFEWIATFMRTQDTREYALSRIEVYARVAVATENPTMLERAARDFDMLLGLTDNDEGPRVDFCQWTHGMPYNNAYGVMNLERVVYVASALAGTPLEFSSPKLYNQFLLVKYMFDTASYKGRAMMMLAGRQTYMDEYVKGASIFAHILSLYGMFGEDEDACISQIFRRQISNPESLRKAKERCNIAECTLIDKILADDTPISDYVYAHSWYTADRAVQHRGNYAFGIALSSEREPSFEAINWENMTGWYTGDGATYLYTDYDYRAYDGKNFYLSNENIAYRYPGTTEDSQPRIAKSISYACRYFSKNSFAGSMQLEDRYIAAAMDFISMNIETDAGTVNVDGYSLPVHKNDLVARKSYFCFDKEMVCLGAGITSTTGYPVSTTVTHGRIVRADGDNQYLDGELLPKSDYEKRDTGARYVNMEGHAGCVFLENAGVYVHRYTHAPSDGQSFLEIGVAHGENPKGASYAYAIIPYASCEALDEYSARPEVRIISNTASLAAVRKEALGITCFVFYEAGECCGIRADAPCMLSVTEREGGYTISIVEPTHKLDTLTLTLDGILEVVSPSPDITVSARDGKACLTVKTANKCGRRIDITVAKS